MPFTDPLPGQPLYAATLNEIILAINERSQALGHGVPFQTIAAGAVLDAGQISDMQTWVDQHCILFLDTESLPDGYDDQPTIEPFWTPANLKAAVNNGFADWRRLEGPDLPADWTDYADPAYGWGYCQPGDAAGAWVLADLQACLKLLTRTRAEFSWDRRGEDTGRLGNGAHGTIWDQAHGDAKNDFDAGTNAADAPYAYSRAYWGEYDGYEADLMRAYSYATVSDVWAGRPVTVKFYCPPATLSYGTGSPNAFDSNGDPVREDAYTYAAQETSQGAEHFAKIGTAGQGDYPACDQPSAYGERYTGYDIFTDTPWATLEWDFEY